MLVGSVVTAAERLDLVQDGREQIRLEEVRRALEGHREALEAGTGVDVLRGELAQHLGVRVDLVLHEDVVPDLHEPVLVHRGAALGPEPRTAVHEDLAARPGGSRGMGPPEVVGLAPAHETLGRHPQVLPDLDGLVVRLVDGHPQPVHVDPEPLRHELQAPGARLGLEVVPEGEVAQHLEEREVPVRVPDVLDVVGAEALLAGGGSVERRGRLAEEVGDELVHAGVGQEQTRLGGGDQRGAGDALVTPLFEEREEPLTDLGAVHAGSLPAGHAAGSSAGVASLGSEGEAPTS